MKVTRTKGLLPTFLLEEPISKEAIKNKAKQEVEVLMAEKTPLEVYAIAHVLQTYIDEVMNKVKSFATEQAETLINGEGKSFTLANGLKVTVATTVDNKYNFETHSEWVKVSNKVKQLEVELTIAKSVLKAIEFSIAAVEKPISTLEKKVLKLTY